MPIIKPETLFNIGMVNGFYSLLLIIVQITYIIFAFLLTRQIKLMNRSFKTPAGPVFTFFGRIHFVGAVLSLIISLLIL